MTDAATEPTLLEEAAAELRAARKSNENRLGVVNAMYAEGHEARQALLAEINQRRMEIADGFTRLAAIERGLHPCCHHAQPGTETS